MITYKIRDLFYLETGFAFKSKDFTDTGIPVLKIKNVKANSIPLHNLSYVEKNFIKTKKDKLARKGDILITMSGNRYDGTKETWVGKVAEFKHEGLYFINQRVGALRVKPTAEIDISCCSYFLSSEGFQNRFIAIATSSGGQANLSPEQILNEIILLPYITNQKAIASVLGALDDKIDNNYRMNETLEEMARAIFKSWFVDFDPVHAKADGNAPAHMDADTAAIFPNSFGNDSLPTGWAVKKIEDVMELAYGKALRASDRKLGEIPVYGSGGITGSHNEALVEGPSVIVGRKGTVGSLFWEDRSFFPIDTTFYIKPKISLVFCYYLLQTLKLNNMNTDAAVPGLNRNNVYRLEFIMPSQSCLLEFQKIIGLMHEKIRSNSYEIRTLTELRDNLLPKLMSGKICVKDAEREMGAAL